MQTLVSVVIPVYNEVENVPILLERVGAVFSSLPEFAYECLVVNDGSTDGTRELLERIQRANAQLRPVHLPQNRGQSAALLAGLQGARGEYILTVDGDLQNDPADFPAFLELLTKYDCVIGVRTNRHDTWVRNLSSRVANAVRNAVLRDGIRDAGCGAKGFRRACLKHIPPFNGVHRFVAVFIRHAGLSIVQCDVTHHPRMHGVSKYGIGNRLWRGIVDMAGVAWLRRRYVSLDVEGEG
jgi:dolichol-phosphate mannosyltransferase